MLRRLFLVLVVAVATLLPASVMAAPAPPNLSVILSAYSYPGEDGQWLGESGPFVNALTERQDATETLPYCTTAWTGKLYGQPALVITMGTAKLESSQCAMNLIFSSYYPRIKEVLWAGIAGFSPRVGGYAGDGEPTIIGDVCVADVVGNWDLTFSSMVTQSFWPMDWPNRASSAQGDADLAREIYRAALKVAWPPLPEGPAANFVKYFPDAKLRQPKAWYGNCAEVTSDNFWHSSLDDAFAREQVAALLGKEPDEVIAVTAMEVLSWMQAFEDAETISGRHIPMAYVRSSSNFDQPWNEETVTGKESIDAGMNGGGSDYGCLTAAAPILKMFELRSKSK
jgi:hypothetical protein